MILLDLHEWLKNNDPPMAISNCGSIYDQTLAGVITTCTHGTGWDFEVLTELVEEIGVVVAGGDAGVDGQPDHKGTVRQVRCSKTVEPELFNATICGLGLTGIITDIKIRVEPAFCLKQVKVPMPMADLLSLCDPDTDSTEKANSTSEVAPLLSSRHLPAWQDNTLEFIAEVKRDTLASGYEKTGQGLLDQIAQSGEHVRMWYYPQSDKIMIARANRVYEVCGLLFHCIIGDHTC